MECGVVPEHGDPPPQDRGPARRDLPAPRLGGAVPVGEDGGVGVGLEPLVRWPWCGGGERAPIHVEAWIPQPAPGGRLRRFARRRSCFRGCGAGMLWRRRVGPLRGLRLVPLTDGGPVRRRVGAGGRRGLPRGGAGRGDRRERGKVEIHHLLPRGRRAEGWERDGALLPLPSEQQERMHHQRDGDRCRLGPAPGGTPRRMPLSHGAPGRRSAPAPYLSAPTFFAST